jgi:hypothetical protein
MSPCFMTILKNLHPHDRRPLLVTFCLSSLWQNETRSEFKRVAPDTNIPQALQQIAGK